MNDVLWLMKSESKAWLFEQGELLKNYSLYFWALSTSEDWHSTCHFSGEFATSTIRKKNENRIFGLEHHVAREDVQLTLPICTFVSTISLEHNIFNDFERLVLVIICLTISGQNPTISGQRLTISGQRPIFMGQTVISKMWVFFGSASWR